VSTIVEMLQGLIEENVRRQISSGAGRIQPVLVGPPESVLRELYAAMTQKDTCDWTLRVSEDMTRQVAVLLVTEPVDQSSSPRSLKTSQCGCGWGYVVSVRDSAATCVILATPAAWNTIPISVPIATKPILTPPDEQPPDVTRVEPWSGVIGIVTRNCSVSPVPVKRSIREVYSALGRTSADDARSDRWEMANDLVSAMSSEEVQRALGLLRSSAPAGPSWDDSRHALSALVKLIKDERLTLDETRRQLHEAVANVTAEGPMVDGGDLDAAIDELFDDISNVAGTALEYVRAPERYMRGAAQDGSWWMVLTAARLQELLDSLGGRTSDTRVDLIVTNSISPEPRLDWPLSGVEVVQRDVRLEVHGKDAPLPNDAPVSVKVSLKGRHRNRVLQSGQTRPDGGLLFVDVPPVNETGCIVYSTIGPGVSIVRRQVVAIDLLECGGLALVEMAESCGLPTREPSSQDFVQKVTVHHAGDATIRVVLASDAVAATIEVPDGDDVQLSRSSGSLTEERVVAVEEGTELVISVSATTGGDTQTQRRWRLVFSIGSDVSDRPTSRTQQLIQMNITGKKTPPMAKNCQLRALEAAALRDDASWLPVTIGVGSPSLIHDSLPLWGESSGVWGNLEVSPVYPQYGEFRPPAEYIETRREICRMLVAAQRPIAEVDLGSSAVQALCKRYLKAYTSWLSQDYEHATWADLFALHLPRTLEGPVARPQGMREAWAILMSPLHPLRLGWHSEAQHVLSESIQQLNPCPGAGMLNCHALPSMLTLLTGSPVGPHGPSHFVRANIDDDYWAAFISCQHMGEERFIERLVPYFEALGTGFSGYTPGFGADQTRRTLDDLVELNPTRSVYRVGVVGVPDSDSECVKGIVAWCADRFGNVDSRDVSTMSDLDGALEVRQQDRGGFLTNAVRCDIYDFRKNAVYPSSTELSTLAEECNERVHWYRKQEYGEEGLDLLIMDQASRQEPDEVSGEEASGLASVLSAKGLLRIDLRRSVGHGGIIEESSVIAGAKFDPDSALRSAHEAFTSAGASSQGIGGVVYKAYLDPLEHGLAHGALVAANVGDLDIAGAIGAAHSDGACIWDFRLPALPSERGNSEGYYLMTRIKPAMSLSVRQAAAALYPDKPPLDGSRLLDLLSRRGVPIIRQLGQNRNQAKGALGILMASQLFRPIDAAGGSTWPVPLMAQGCLNLVLPVDPIWAPIGQLERSKLLKPFSKSHADLLLVSSIADGDKYTIQIIPIEVKVRTNETDTSFLRGALSQAENVANIAERLWASAPPNTLWSECSQGLLARCLEFGFRLHEESGLLDTLSDDAPRPRDWSQRKLGLLQAVLEKRVHVLFPSRGIVVAFGCPGETWSTVLGESTAPNVLFVGSDDAYALLAGQTPSSHALEVARAMMIPLLANAVAVAEHPPVTGEPPIPPVTGEPPIPPVTGEPPIPPVTGEPVPVGNVVAPAGPGRIPQEVRNSVKSAMVGFIGNENAVSRVSNDLILALVQDPPHLPKNYLFTGLPSTGKTELCRRIARVMKLPFIALDGHGVGDREHLFDLVDGQLTADFGPKGGKVDLPVESGLAAVEYPPCVVMIDEVHLLSRPVQESLLKALEINDRSMALKERVVHLKNMTFLLATTRPSVLDKAFKSRCTVIELLAYSESQVAQIVHDRVVPELEGRGLAPWTEGIYTRLARLGGVVPRKSLDLAKELQTEIVVSDVGGLSLEEHLDAVQRRMGIDDNGLGQLHIKYLRILQKRGPCGFGSIIGQLDTVDEGTILDEVEPRLLTLGLIEKTPQGRQITTAGLLYLSRFDGTASS